MKDSEIWDKFKEKLSLDYDESADVLYAYFDEPKKAKCTEYGDGVIIRTEPDSDKIVGFTIIGFKERFV